MNAFIEPTEAGHRLRLAASNDTPVAGMVLGGIFLALALFIFVVLLGKDALDFRLAIPAFFSLIGGGLVAGSGMALPAWARDQEKRMEHISRHAVSLLALPAPTGDESGA